MNDESTIQRGRVTKIVRVTQNESSNADQQRREDLEGYGIIRSKNGREVFFVAASLAELAFARLQTGTSVRFTLEPGPFSKAGEVWLEESQEGVACSRQMSQADST